MVDLTAFCILFCVVSNRSMAITQFSTSFCSCLLVSSVIFYAEPSLSLWAASHSAVAHEPGVSLSVSASLILSHRRSSHRDYKSMAFCLHGICLWFGPQPMLTGSSLLASFHSTILKLFQNQNESFKHLRESLCKAIR